MEYNKHESAFQFKSVFRYTEPSADPIESNKCQHQDQLSQKILVNLFTGFLYCIFVVTLPFSAWFCIKRVKALERLCVFRFGKRLPLRGPGFTIIFPCVDVMDRIDLSPQTVVLAKNEQMLTSDGSVVEVLEFNCEISVANVIRSFTHAKDSRYNSEQFVKLSFANMVASSHVEDLERKIDWMVKKFSENVNLYINGWGWQIHCYYMPKFKVISRADPVNPIMATLKSYFGVESDNEKLPSALPPKISNIHTSHSFEDDIIESSIEQIASKYAHYNVFGYAKIKFSVEIVEDNKKEYFLYTSSTGKISKIQANEDDKVNLAVKAKNLNDFIEFVNKDDTTKIEISTSF